MSARTKTFLFIIVAFLLGGVGGGFVGKDYFNRGRSHKKPERSEIRKHFAEKLQLDQRQQATVDSIVEVHRSKIDTISQQYSQRFKLQRDTLRQEIRKLLTPEQNTRYDEFIKEIDERDQKKRQNPM
ncbi:MAG: hypothetical protein L0Y80_13100 [Ignavibacteriae bacterium]|nr:hypothetical protein [Ignavibacteriota bacterium]